ncbi:hypothetical protein JL721_11711 [Aureococcus anophagefferens]|nr:hypothetical protein JL721_11711 [Aureococcus anophagefferens]
MVARDRRTKADIALSPRSAVKLAMVQVEKAKPLEEAEDIESVLRASADYCEGMMEASEVRRAREAARAPTRAAGPSATVHPTSRYAGKPAKKRPLPLMDPSLSGASLRRSKVGTPLSLEDLEKAARSVREPPRRGAARAREALRRKKAESARLMAKRKALLPYLEGIHYNDMEVTRVKRKDRKLRKVRARELLAADAESLDGSVHVPDVTAAQDKKLRRAMTPAESKATQQRTALLKGPDDTVYLTDHSARLLRRMKRKAVEAERVKTGSAPVTSVAADCRSVCGRFPWFGERMKILDYGQRADAMAPPRDRGSAWLLATLAFCYDALYDANGRCGAPRARPKSKPPRPDAIENLHTKKVRPPRVPDVVADAFWRSHGAVAPCVAYEFCASSSAEICGCEDSTQFISFDGGATTPKAMVGFLLERLEELILVKYTGERTLFGPPPAGACLVFPALGAPRLDGLEYCDLTTLLDALSLAIDSAPEDLVAFVKFDDDGERLSMVNALQSAMDDATQSNDLIQEVRVAERAVTRAEVATMKVKFQKDRLDKMQSAGDAAAAGALLAFRTKLLVAEAEVSRNRAVLEEKRSTLANLERRADATWDSLIANSAHAAPVGHTKDHDAWEAKRRDIRAGVAKATKRVRRTRAVAARPRPSSALRLFASCGAPLRRGGALQSPAAAPRRAALKARAAGDATFAFRPAPKVAARWRRASRSSSSRRPDTTEHYDAADMDAVLAPWVAWQDAHCAKIQRWVRGRQAKKRVMARPTVVALVQNRDKVRYVAMVQEQRSKEDAVRAADRDMIRLLTLRREEQKRRKEFRDEENARLNSTRCQRGSLAIQCWYRTLVASRFVRDLRETKKVKLALKKREQEAVYFKKRVMRRWSHDVFRHWRRCARAEALGKACLLRRVYPHWRAFVDAQVAENDALRTWAADKIRLVVRGRLQRKAYRRVVRRHHAARLVQNTLVRKYLARNDFTRRVHATWAARGPAVAPASGRGLRAWNRHELLAAAYADTAKVLVKRQRAALRVRSLASTHALTTKHPAQGDLAIHRPARGVGPHAVASCIGALGMAADCYNDGGSAPLHLVGFDLDPPARIVRIREKEREKQRLWEQEQKADRAAALEAEQAFEAGKPEFLKLAQKAVKEDAAVDEQDKTNTRQSMRGPHALGEQPSVAESSLGEAGAEDPKEGHRLGSAKRLDDLDDDEVKKGVLSMFDDWFDPEEESLQGDVEALNSDVESDRSSLGSAGSDASDLEELQSHISSAAATLLEAGADHYNAVVDTLLRHGADIEAPDAVGRTPLHAAIDRGDFGLCGILMDRGADVNAVDYAGFSCLSLAARRGRVLIARSLVRRGAEVDLPGGRAAARRTSDDDNDADGTPEAAILQMLLERSVDGNVRDGRDMTPLMLAAKADRVDAVQALVNIADVDILATDKKGQTALHMAARVGSVKTVKALLKCGHDVRVMDHEGNQPVHAACRGGDVLTVETLVAYDAPLGCRNWAGFTPIGVARMCGRRRLPADKWVKGWSGEEGFSDIVWTHEDTGEVRALPPSDTAEHVRDLCRKAWPKTVLKRQLVVAKDTDGDDIEVGAAEYEYDRKKHDREVAQLRREHAGATLGQLHDLLWWRRAERHLGVKMQRLWRGHVSRRFLRRARCMKYGPRRFEAWALVVTESGEPLRKYGIYEERLYPRRFAHPKDCERIADLGPCFRDVKFYYNRVTGRCDWDMPSDWIVHDANEFRKREESRKRGFTDEEAAAASTLQAIWKGRRDRMNLKATIQGAKLMRSCEDEYLEDPMNLRKMTYYVLYLHAMTKERGAPLYQHCMTRMRDRGPTTPGCSSPTPSSARRRATRTGPSSGVRAPRRASRRGPLHGDRRGYDLADGGFFRAATAADPCGWTWHNYALCRWLAYGDMKGAERSSAYPNKRDSISCYDVIRQDATRQMVRELENEEKRRERQRNDPRRPKYPKPEELKLMAEANEQKPANDADEWEAHRDEGSGQMYF